jgi:hypothetical protein
MNKDDKNRHFMLLIIDISKHGARILAFLQSSSVPELDMHESKHFLPGQFVHSDYYNVLSRPVQTYKTRVIVY